MDSETVTSTLYDSYDGGRLAFHASVEADVTFDAYMRKADFYAIDEEDNSIAVADWDVNDHMLQVQVEKRMLLWFQVDVDGSDIANIEFDSAELHN